jgi:hypothetical protein
LLISVDGMHALDFANCQTGSTRLGKSTLLPEYCRTLGHAGGYTAWSDKHRSWDFTIDLSGNGVDD